MQHSEESGGIDGGKTALLERAGATARIDGDGDRAGGAEELLARGVDDKVLVKRADARESDANGDAGDVERGAGGDVRVDVELELGASADGADGGNPRVVQSGAGGDRENVEEVAVAAVDDGVDVDAPAEQVRSDAERI